MAETEAKFPRRVSAEEKQFRKELCEWYAGELRKCDPRDPRIIALGQAAKNRLGDYLLSRHRDSWWGRLFG